MIDAVVDNDILFKGAAFGLLEELIAVMPAEPKQVGTLGASRYVISAKLVSHLGGGATQAEAYFKAVSKKMIVLEPNPAETEVAAEIELAAQLAQLELDTGESQLCAIVIARDLPLLATGDKRAIVAIEQLLDRPPISLKLIAKLLCLEQLFQRLVAAEYGGRLRAAVCQHPQIDRTLSICFGCAGQQSDKSDWMDGLASYIRDLRALAARVLVP
jgi:hypothetical protein